MVKNLEDALDEAVPLILEMMAKCEKNPALTQPIIEEICELAVLLDVAYWDRVFPHRAGIHPKNRGCTGVDPFNAQNLVARISKVGFALKKLENPMGFEKAHGKAGKLQEEFMDKIGVRRNRI